MRIAFFSDNFHPELGGIQDAIELVARELADRGHTIDIYAPRYSVPDFARVQLEPREIDLGDGVNIRRIRSIPYPGPTEQSRLAIPSLASILRMRQPDIIHVHNIFGMGLTGLAAARYLKIPVIGTNHTAIKAFAPYIRFNIDWVVAYALWFFNRCDLASAPSRSVFDDTGIERLSRPPAIIPNAVDVETFSPRTRTIRSELKTRLGLSEHTIVYAGRLATEKNIDVIIRAIALLKKQFPSICLALAGHGSDERRLRTLVEELGVQSSVRFFGTLRKPELAKLFLASEVAVTMSTSETQCLSLIQAMASGLPVIGADARALPEFISEKIGALVKQGDFLMLSEQVSRLLRDRNLCQQLGENASTFARTFSVKRITSEWELLYRRFSN